MSNDLYWRMEAERARQLREQFSPRHGLDPDPPRCWSCGHPFGAGCECTCCYDDHSEEPSPHE